MAPDKETRNVFRSFMKANPDAFDYVAAQIPPPLTEEAEAKQREKAKLKRLAKKEKEKQKKEEELAKKKDEDDKKRFLALSDREKPGVGRWTETPCGQDWGGRSKASAFALLHLRKRYDWKSPIRVRWLQVLRAQVRFQSSEKDEWNQTVISFIWQ